MKAVKDLLDALMNKLNGFEESIHADDSILEGLPRSLQLDRYSCGAQSAYMILRYHGKARSVKAVERALGTTEERGTPAAPILRLMRQRRLRPRIVAEATMKTLTSAIDKGAPVLVSLEDGGHWGVVYGYGAKHIWLADPSLRRAVLCRVARAAFRARWDRWAMVVAA